MVFVTLVGMTDVIVYFCRQSDTADPISYPAHISGAAVGLLAGITFLKNLRWENFERYIWAASACITVLLLLLPAVFSLANPSHFEPSGKLLTPHVTCTSGPIII
jgi:hypothetical protein